MGFSHFNHAGYKWKIWNRRGNKISDMTLYILNGGEKEDWESELTLDRGQGVYTCASCASTCPTGCVRKYCLLCVSVAYSVCEYACECVPVSCNRTCPAGCVRECVLLCVRVLCDCVCINHCILCVCGSLRVCVASERNLLQYVNLVCAMCELTLVSQSSISLCWPGSEPTSPFCIIFFNSRSKGKGV